MGDGVKYPREVIIVDLRRDEDFAKYEKRMRSAVDHGDKSTLLRFISMCFRVGRTVPEWAQQGFQDAVNKGERHEIKFWEEVFGWPLEKGKQHAARRRRAALYRKIYERVGQLSEAGEPISKTLFDIVGREFGVSATVAEEIYREFKEFLYRTMESAKPEVLVELWAFLLDALPPEQRERIIAETDPAVVAFVLDALPPEQRERMAPAVVALLESRKD
jgi:hypothetical protein